MTTELVSRKEQRQQPFIDKTYRPLILRGRKLCCPLHMPSSRNPAFPSRMQIWLLVFLRTGRASNRIEGKAKNWFTRESIEWLTGWPHPARGLPPMIRALSDISSLFCTVFSNEEAKGKSMCIRGGQLEQSDVPRCQIMFQVTSESWRRNPLRTRSAKLRRENTTSWWFGCRWLESCDLVPGFV